MPPTTVDRVPDHTAESVNRRIEQSMAERVAALAANPQRVEARLRELDREWDIERTLEANAASVALAGIGLAAFVDMRWLVLPAAVVGFLLQHAVQGWCPPLPVFRRLGFRTAHEIEEERQALKALRGDYAGIEASRDPAAALAAAKA